MARTTKTPDIAPSISADRAVTLLKKALAEIPGLEESSFAEPQYSTWERTTTEILHAAFGKPSGQAHQNAREFEYASGGGVPLGGMRYEQQVRWTQRQCNHRRAILESAIQQLEMLAPPSARNDDTYCFHPEIERVSGIAADGEALMNRAFGCENQHPVIRFNALITQADKDEQRGFMNIFKGIGGLRNLKAHTVLAIDDPYRGHEYLAMASVLMRVLESAKVEPNP